MLHKAPPTIRTWLSEPGSAGRFEGWGIWVNVLCLEPGNSVDVAYLMSPDEVSLMARELLRAIDNDTKRCGVYVEIAHEVGRLIGLRMVEADGWVLSASKVKHLALMLMDTVRDARSAHTLQSVQHMANQGKGQWWAARADAWHSLASATFIPREYEAA